MKLTDACIDKPVFAWMIMLATLVFGGVAASRIGISQFPDVDFPTISVQINWEGAAPEAVEHDVVEIAEEAIIQVEGVRSISSTSRQGGATITVELDVSRDVDVALQEVQTKLAGAQMRLPKDLDPPIVSKSNPEDQPIMWIGLSGPYSPQVLSDYVRYRLKEKLQTIKGVGEIILGGSLERNVRIWVDADKLDAQGLTVTDVLAALQREHVEMPAGRLEAFGREVNVRVMGEALDLDQLRNIIIEQRNGAPVHLQDVALVEDGFEDMRRLSRVGGQTAQGLGIRKQRGANAVAVARAVRAELDAVRPSLPEGMDLGINFDSTQFIEESVDEMEFELVLAVLLTALVCWIFLGSLSSTLNVVLAIPMSLLGTIGAIYFFGFTLNTFTLLGLALAVGIVVDDAIMVMENISRHSEMGKSRVRAAREGTAEITFAALAATSAVIAIFAPVIFMEGIIGAFFLQFGVTLSIAVLLSYLEAMTLAPSRSAQLLRAHGERETALGRAVDRAFKSLAARYEWMLERGLRHPVLVLAGAIGLFAATFGVFRVLPTEFAPSQDQSRLMLRLQTAVGSSLDETDTLFKRAEAIVNSKPELDRAFVVVGGFRGDGVNSGIMFLTLVPPRERKLTQNEFGAVLRKELNSIPGLRVVVQDLSQTGFTAQRGFPVELSVRGPDWDQLVAISSDLRRKLTESGAVVDLDTDYQVGMPELQIVPDRAHAADLGVSVVDIASSINALIGGIRVGKYSTGGRRVDVRLRLLSEQRSRPEDLDRLYVRNSAKQLIPLSTLVTRKERPVLQTITRRDRERAIGVFGNVAAGHSQGEVLEMVEKLSRDLPPGYHVVPGGASVAFKESMTGLIFALFLGIGVAYMVLASQFNSFLHPLAVLSILPLAFAGAAFGLWSTGATVNIFSMIGILLLMGIVKKNSIILVDYANIMRREGHDPVAAMRLAGPRRLRPILMTSVTTMMSAVPAALALGPGSETRGPMAAAVLGGLIVSTGLSLLVVPAFYVLLERIKAALGFGAVEPEHQHDLA